MLLGIWFVCLFDVLAFVGSLVGALLGSIVVVIIDAMKANSGKQVFL